MAKEDIDNQLDELEDEDETEDEDESTDESEETEESEETDESAKSVRELQSARDKETARANKAEKELKRLQALSKGDSGDDPEKAAELAELREDRIDALLGESDFSPLKTYGIDRALILGQTRAELRESAAELVGLVKRIETKARNAALKEAGITPSPVSGKAEPKKNYATMSTEDFEKELARARNGGREPTW